MIQEVKNFITDYRTTAKFLLTGSIGVLIDNGVLYLLHSVLGVPAVLGKAVSTESAILLNFVINDSWTFNKGDQPGSKKDRLIKSNSIRLLGLTASVITLFILYNRLNIDLLISNTLSIGVGFIFNYIMESYAWEMHKK